MDFHRHFDAWSVFFENFVVDEGLDLRREYFRTLAFSQHVTVDHGLEPRRLMPFWLSICAECGESGRYHPFYLRIAMIGLGRLPSPPDGEIVANEDLALRGLACWAATQLPDKKSFAIEWRLLQDDFKYGSGFWKEHVQAAISVAERELSERTGGVETTFPVAEWWRRDVGLDLTWKSPG